MPAEGSVDFHQRLTFSQAPSAMTLSGLALFFLVERLLVGPVKLL